MKECVKITPDRFQLVNTRMHAHTHARTHARTHALTIDDPAKNILREKACLKGRFQAEAGPVSSEIEFPRHSMIKVVVCYS